MSEIGGLETRIRKRAREELKLEIMKAISELMLTVHPNCRESWSGCYNESGQKLHIGDALEIIGNYLVTNGASDAEEDAVKEFLATVDRMQRADVDMQEAYDRDYPRNAEEVRARQEAARSMGLNDPDFREVETARKFARSMSEDEKPRENIFDKIEQRMVEADIRNMQKISDDDLKGPD